MGVSAGRRLQFGSDLSTAASVSDTLSPAKLQSLETKGTEVTDAAKSTLMNALKRQRAAHAEKEETVKGNGS